MTEPAVPRILDHLVYAVPELAEGMADIASRTGAEPVFGGAHVGRGTANYLLGLRLPDPNEEEAPAGDAAAADRAERIYLEILGPDPDQIPPAGGVLPLDAHLALIPRLQTWAVRPDDFDATVAAAETAQIDVGDVQDMSRRTADGELLDWRLTTRTPLPAAGLQPFLIDWKDSAHPSESDMPELVLDELWFETPDVTGLRADLAALGVTEARIEPAEVPALRARLTGPAGTVEL